MVTGYRSIYGKEIISWIDELLYNVEATDLKVLVILGNKADLEEKREVWAYAVYYILLVYCMIIFHLYIKY